MGVMDLRVLVVVAVVAMVGATAVEVCSTDLDCHLNGECKEGRCECYSPWGGEDCGVLLLLPAVKGTGYGYAPNRTTWGGNAVRVAGEYHLYAAEITRGCPMKYWLANSLVAHAVSKTPLGPYERRGVAVGEWAHNPQVVQGEGLFAIFHIGNGSGPATTECTVRPFDLHNATVHVAHTPDGPFNPVTLPFVCNNPAPMWHASAWYVVCNAGVFELWTSPTLQGEWRHIATLPPNPKGTGIWEDPFIYVDPRGNWHVLVHAYVHEDPCGACNSTLTSGQYYSRDGVEWFASKTEAYGPVVQFTDGTSHRMSTRERPKLMFLGNNPRQPTHLSTGVTWQSNCRPEASCQCKYQFWDYTLIQELHS